MNDKTTKPPSGIDRVYLASRLDGLIPAQLIVLLYDRAISSLAQAEGAIASEDTEDRDQALSRADAIIYELLAALDVETGDIAISLQQLYIYMIHRIAKARFGDDIGAASEVRSLLSELREAWNTIAADEKAAAKASQLFDDMAA